MRVLGVWRNKAAGTGLDIGTPLPNKYKIAANAGRGVKKGMLG
jgi:hypothetical protein